MVPRDDAEVTPHPGFTPTGRTNAFNIDYSKRDATIVSSQTNYLKQDFYELCAYRFNRWYECDFMFEDQKLAYSRAN